MDSLTEQKKELSAEEKKICANLDISEEEYLKTAPEGDKSTALSAEEKKICSNVGISDEEYLKTAF